MINPARPPEDILEQAEVEKICMFQNTKEAFLLSGVSPDDMTVIVAAGTAEDSIQTFWQNLRTGELKPINSEFTKLFPQGDIHWLDHQTVVYLSSNANGDPVIVTVPRDGAINVSVSHWRFAISGPLLDGIALYTKPVYRTSPIFDERITDIVGNLPTYVLARCGSTVSLLRNIKA